jgi:hypothetical protein
MKPTNPPELPNVMKVVAAASQIVAVVPMFMAALLVNAALPKKAK